MARVLRFDRGTLRSPTRTPQGFLRVDGYVSRPGIYEYRNDDGSIRRELRPDAEVFATAARAGFDGAPITLGHPVDDKGEPARVTAENVKRYEVGTVTGEAREDGGKVAATLVVKDARAIATVERGKQELSPGYAIDLIEQRGVDPKYGRYDAIQTNIVINHLAIVDRARGGSTMRLRMDAADEVRTDEVRGRLTTAVDGHQHLVGLSDHMGNPCSSGTTSWSVAEGAEIGHDHAWVSNNDGSITIAESAGHTHQMLVGNSSAMWFTSQRADVEIDRSITCPQDVLMANENREDEVADLRGQLAAIEKERDELREKLKVRMDAAESEAVKTANERADAAESRLDEYKSGFSHAVKRLTSMTTMAKSVMGPNYRVDDKDEAQIVRDVVKRLDSSIDVINTPFAELNGHLKQLVARHERARTDYADAGKIIGTGGSTRSDEQAKAKLDDEWNNQWKRTIAPRKDA